MAWRDSGTRCGRFIFMVAAGTIQTALSKSISFQCAKRLAGPHEQQRRQFERKPGRRLPAVSLDSPQKRAELDRVGNGCAVLYFRVVRAPRRSTEMSRMARPVAIA